MKNHEIPAKMALFVLFGLALAGCPPKKKPISPVEPLETPQALEETDAPGPGDIEIGTDWTNAPPLPAVGFETNKSELSQPARTVLKKNAAILKAVLAVVPSAQVRIEGHCDERNTLEYNLALGQRRANAVRDYYATLGVPKKSLTTVSYGEERPLCASADEGCWSRNRRGETTLRSSAPVRVPASKLPQ